MNTPHALFRLPLIGTALLVAGTTLAATPLRTDHLSSQLVAESTRAVRGQPLKIGLHLQHDPKWHTYWVNPGDSGLPTRISLELPPGVTASGIQWPAPHRFDISDIANFGYGDTMVLPLTLDVPADFKGDTLAISAKASWLICDTECIPGRGEYALSLPVADAPTPDAQWQTAFATATARQPAKADVQAHYRVEKDRVEVELRGAGLPAAIAAWEVFPITAQVVANNAWPTWSRLDGGFRLSLPQSEFFASAPERFELLLVSGDTALSVDATLASP